MRTGLNFLWYKQNYEMMKREKSIELLNRAVNDELSAVHQYMYFHFRCDDMGYELLSELFRRVAIQEMMHVERLAERILFLKGEVEMEPSHPVAKPVEPAEMLKRAVAMETQTVGDYNLWAQECSAALDAASKKLFELLVEEEEVHQDQFETELDNLGRFGANYLALQSVERSKNVAAATPSAPAE
jgi:bacterioferritin